MAKKKSFENIISNLLGEPVCNLSNAFYDQYVEANVKFRSKAGMKAVIIRRQLGKCCDWCAERSGIFAPENAPAGIYGRHDCCKCIVTFKDENGYTDAWSKKQFRTQREARKARESEIVEEIKNVYIKKKIEESIFDGASIGEIKSLIRRIKFRKEWAGYSFTETLKRYFPEKYNIKEGRRGKLIFWSEESTYEIIYDTNLDYFRIADTSIAGKNYQKKYVDINGENVHNVTVDGKTRGRSDDEWQKITHFRDIDKEP